MSGGVKFMIAVVFLILLYVIYDLWKKNQAKEEAKKKTCEDLSTYEYINKKTEIARRIMQEYLTKGVQYISANGQSNQQNNPLNVLANEYREEAVNKGGVIPGTNETEENIRAFAYKKMAQKEMDDAGYCPKTVIVDLHPNDVLLD